MQAVILAGGSHLVVKTRVTPKCLLKIGRKTLIEHLAFQLPSEVTEIVIVVGQLKTQIKDQVGKNLSGRPVRYVTQDQQLGTGHALSVCQPIITSEKFLVLMGDNLYLKRDIARCLQHPRSILAKKLETPERFGVITTGGQRLFSVAETPKKLPGTLINCGLYVLDQEIFDQPLVEIDQDEYGLPQQVAKLDDVFVERADFWLPIGTVQDLKLAGKYLKKLYS